MAFGTRVEFEAIRELDFGDISGTYAALGTPLTDNTRLITFSNSMNEELYISFDGTTNHLRIANNSFKLLDLSANKVRDDGLFIAAGTQIYIKEVSSTPTSGSVWMEVMYASGGK
jgi:hypothetical protein